MSNFFDGRLCNRLDVVYVLLDLTLKGVLNRVGELFIEAVGEETKERLLARAVDLIETISLRIHHINNATFILDGNLRNERFQRREKDIVLGKFRAHILLHRRTTIRHLLPCKIQQHKRQNHHNTS